MEEQIIRDLTAALTRARWPVSALKVFGSRARGRSDENSDLDIAVILDSERDRELGQEISALARKITEDLEDETSVLRVQLVPFFRGDEGGFLARTIENEAVTVWTKI